MERQVYTLTTSRVREFATRAITQAPDGWTVRITPPPRTGAQNAGTHVIYEMIAQAFPHDDAAGWKRYCKLHFGVPILRAEAPDFREAYDKSIKPLPYETKLAVMAYWPVTSIMDRSQIARYIDAIRADFEPRGVDLSLSESTA
ncbi:hypothetical protein [Castellaniella denitrificans]|uniref:Uncharacterized protein n=1 Tax=Castellaniella denitrificans TaxID=56119 RepID=A0ABT4M705_9BURK|nr:hypothetical protein [Castellaniella denitrificans]MCZ4330755.1 hypothetical protein [Castellaniella denitrificans]